MRLPLSLALIACLSAPAAIPAAAVTDALQVQAEAGISTSRTALQAAYHGGRAATYVGLGAAAGAFGSLVDLGGKLVGVQRVAAVVAGALMVGFGAVALLRVAGARLNAGRSPAVLQRAWRTPKPSRMLIFDRMRLPTTRSSRSAGAGASLV